MLADFGARLVLAGTAGTDEAAAIDSALTDLRGAGADVSYVPADLSDPDEAEAAIARVEQRIGPVTAVVHTASTGPLRACADLAGDDLGAQIASQADGLSNVLGAVSAAGLRALVTLGTVPARYGAARNCAPALAASALAEQARRLRPSLPGCRILHADWPWPGGSDPAGVAARARPQPRGLDDATAAELSRLLLVLLADTARRAGSRCTAASGRPPTDPGPAAGDRRPVPGDGPGVLPGRGTGRRCEVLPPYRPVPGRSPYRRPHGASSGHGAGGHGPGGVGAGRAAAAATGEARMDAPVVLLPGDQETTLRICALRRADAVETVLRCADSGFQVNHFRAMLPARPRARPNHRAGQRARPASSGPSGSG